MTVPDRVVARIVGEGEPAAVLKLEQECTPALLDGECLVEMILAAVDPCDSLMMLNIVPPRRDGVPPAHPVVAGGGGVGRIVQVGPGCTRAGLAAGVRVVMWCWRIFGPAWEEINGTWGTRVVASEHQLVPLPDTVPDAMAAQMINLVTAWAMVVDPLGLAVQRGHTLLQSGGGSAMGQFIKQLGRALGFRVLSLVRRAEHAEELRATWGDSDYFVLNDATDQAALVRELRAAAGGAGADFAVDCVGHTAADVMMKSLRAGGTMMLYGLLSSTLYTPYITDLTSHNRVLRGFSLQYWWLPDAPDVQKERAFTELFRLIGEGAIRTPAHQRIPFTRLHHAIVVANSQSGYTITRSNAGGSSQAGSSQAGSSQAVTKEELAGGKVLLDFTQ